ncbi:hypothetical protein MJO28_012631 [Puccinia striiformis f. sp. tritici]|uniref:Uncharacterized protein n=3 Tax=Puccinia striiformis TaxID=27350 RepID=A0A2S4UEB2_9BASI|nr:hypothetical protein MJO28_017775 [Puccinia striiformis f. sp. tritici]POV95590.1 hypothetical protein PSHT_15592 [Puccinia striiformis]KAI7942604.1 hypothetical protein MJO28_012631 [Puccinia striiformis f. sp. tritici]KAI7945414.1 hypothetical protein MJO29_011802 [Puccinia striiformis f. sp. tritici]POV99248.1 hypothetical protein PSHT_13758 [Puccinia striiformis]
MKLMIPILSCASALVLLLSKATASHVKNVQMNIDGSPLEGKCEPGVFKCCHNDLVSPHNAMEFAQLVSTLNAPFDDSSLQASNPHARGGCQ